MDVGDIKKLIEKDKNRRNSSYCRYPVRFIFMNLSNKTSNEIAELVTLNQADFVRLQEHLKNDDGWITKTQIMSIVNNCSKEKDTFIVGFSELVRFYSGKELESLVLSLVGDVENDLSNALQTKRRIYFICFSLISYFQQVIKEKFRRFNVYDPFINAEYAYPEKAKELFFINNNLDISETKNVIRTSKEWIGLWQSAGIIDYSLPLICVSEILYLWYEKVAPDNVFEVEVIRDYKQLIERFLEIKIPFEYQTTDFDKWEQLYKYITRRAKKLTFSEIILDICNAKSIDEVGAFVKSFSLDDKFKKWLITQFIKSEYPDKLITKILKNRSLEKDKDVNDIIEELVNCPYKDLPAESIEERNLLIKTIKNHINIEDIDVVLRKTIDDSFSAYINYQTELLTIDDIVTNKLSSETMKKVYSRCTEYAKNIFRPAYVGLFPAEKEIIIKMLVSRIISLNDVQEMYPQLFEYAVGNTEKRDLFFDEYFNEYRKSKLNGKDTERLTELISQCNGTEQAFCNWYYKYKTQSELLKNYENEAIYIIDGLGAEYFPVILEVLSWYNYEAKIAQYAVAHIPSITCVNKKYITSICNPIEWYVDFDRKAIHGEYYLMARNLRKSLDILSELIGRIVANQEGASFIITADHGATARGKWCKTEKKYNFEYADHEGRCAKLTDANILSTDDYIISKDDEQEGLWCVSLREISLNKNPRYEDHGGATPEEVVVPFIRAVKMGVKKDITYRVQADKAIVTGIDKQLRFIISPHPNSAYVVDGDDIQHELIFENNKWSTNINSGRTQIVSVHVGNQIFEFYVKNKSASNMGGEDGFDDFD